MTRRGSGLLLCFIMLGCSSSRAPEIPAEGFPDDDPSSYSEHPTLLLPMSRARAMVMFDDDVPWEDSVAAIDHAGGRAIGRLAELGIFFVEVDDPGDHSGVDTLLASLDGAPGIVATAHIPLLGSLVATPGGSVAAANASSSFGYQGIVNARSENALTVELKVAPDLDWGLEFARVPSVWNLRRHIERLGSQATVLVIENNFTFSTDLLAIRYFPAGPGVSGELPDHGLGVASVIAGGWGMASTTSFPSTDRVTGVDGIVPVPINLIGVPLSDLNETGTLVPSSFARSIARIHGALTAAAPVHVMNISQGYNWWNVVTSLTSKGQDPRVGNGDDRLQPKIELEIINEAKLFARVVARARTASPGLVIAIAAGNEGEAFQDFPPDAESPFAYAAVHGLIDNGIVVGSIRNHRELKIGRARHSSAPPMIWAPGENIGVLGDETGNGEKTSGQEGTSFASPFVAGVATIVHLLRPNMTGKEVKELILSHGASQTKLLDATLAASSGNTIPIIDAFSVVMGLDADGPGDVQAALVDVDDGTPDGCKRVALNIDGSEGDVQLTDAHGDGVVDMRDFRRFRDAYELVYHDALSANGAPILDGIGDLSQGKVHPKMDLNEDGGPTGFDTHAGELEFYVIPSGKSLRGENVWSRFDYNGDGQLHLERTLLPFNGKAVTDLGVMAEVWGREIDAGYVTRGADLEGWDAAKDDPSLLRRLMKSADVEVRVGNAFAADPSLEEVEIHVWNSTPSAPDEESQFDAAHPNPRVRRVKRTDLLQPYVVFTLQLKVPDDETSWPGDTISVRAFGVTTKGLVSLTPTEGSAGTFHGDRVDHQQVLVGQDRLAVFGPNPNLELVAYLMPPDLGFPVLDLNLADTSGTVIKKVVEGVSSVALACSPTGEHITYRILDEAFTYPGGPTIEMTDAVKGAPLLSDDQRTWVWIERPGADTKIVVTPTGEGTPRTFTLADFQVAPGSLSLSADGKSLIVGDGSADGYGGIAPGEVPDGPHDFVVNLTDGTKTPLYDKVITMTWPMDLGVAMARVRIFGAAFTAAGDVIFSSDEDALNAMKTSIEGSTDPDANKLGELFRAAPGAINATQLTFSSHGDPQTPALSPSGTHAFYGFLNHSPVQGELRLLTIGTEPNVLQVLPPGLFGAASGRVCWLKAN